MKSEIVRLEREIWEFAAKAEKIDREEDTLYGKGEEAHEIPEELRRRQERLERIAEAKEELEQEARSFRRFSLRGARKVACEWTLVCLCGNLLKLV